MIAVLRTPAPFMAVMQDEPRSKHELSSCELTLHSRNKVMKDMLSNFCAAWTLEQHRAETLLEVAP